MLQKFSFFTFYHFYFYFSSHTFRPLHVLILCAEINSIKITKMRVPSTYIIEPANKNPLILDCEYDIDPQKETMFVLKWLFNKAQIYQWIPPRPPKQFVAFKNHVNVSYVASTESLHQHRAVFISKPAWNLTGQYTCSVNTLTSNDKKTSFLQIIGSLQYFYTSNSRIP
jgi:hypothetical protein